MSWNQIKYSCRECGIAFKENDRIGFSGNPYSGCQCWFHSGCMVRLIDSGKLNCSKCGVVWEASKGDEEMMEAAEKPEEE